MIRLTLNRFNAFYLLFFLSGMSALFYQLIWQRSLFNIYGVNIESVTVIVSAFMLGLGLGSLLGGWLSLKSPKSLLTYFGLIELTIGIFGYFSLSFFSFVGDITLLFSTIKTFLVIFGLIVIPTLLMGATLPLLVMHLTKINPNVGKNVGILYFINTCGSAFACFIIAFNVMHFLTQTTVVHLAAATNIFLGSCALGLSKLVKAPLLEVITKEQTQATESDYSPSLTINLTTASLLSFLAGYIALSYEIVWIRIYSFMSEGLASVFAAVLGYYLLGIAAGSLFSNYFITEHKSKNNSLWILYLTILISSSLSFLLIPSLGYVSLKHSYIETLPWVGIITIFFGFSLPIISHNAIKPHRETGSALSKIYFANIAGATAGSLITGFILLEYWSLVSISLELVYVSLILSLLILAILYYKKKLSYAGLFSQTSLIIVIGILVWFAAPWLYKNIYEKLLFKNTYNPFDRFTDIVENRSGVITVDKKHYVFGNGAYDGKIDIDFSDDKNGLIRVLFISAIHAKPENILMVGLSSGPWAQLLANHPQVKKLTVIEINPGYLKLISHYPAVSSLLRNPRVTIITDDGRRWLRRHSKQKFDMIIFNTTFNWRNHSSSLLSKNFLQMLRFSLKKGGIIYYNTTYSQEAMRTAAITFPYVIRFINFIAASDSPIIIDKQQRDKVLNSYTVDGKKLLDFNNPKVSYYINKTMALTDDLTFDICSKAVDSKKSILFRTKKRKIITDDNMGNEWDK